MAAKRLLYNALSLRKSNAEMLLKYVRNVNSQNITKKEDFGTPYHTAASEHEFVVNDPIAIDFNGKAHLPCPNSVDLSGDNNLPDTGSKPDTDSKPDTSSKSNTWPCSIN